MSEIDRQLKLIRERSRPGDGLAISGGEPTTHPHLAEIISRARHMGFESVRLQTNAVFLSKPELVRNLGGMDYFVSFQSHEPAVYDRITGTKGQYRLALQGIRNILCFDSGWLTLNIVVNKLNQESLPEYVDFIHHLLAGRDKRVSLFFSMMNDVGIKKSPALAVPLTEAGPSLRKALARCRSCGIDVVSFSGDCAFPACLLRDPETYIEKDPCSQEGVCYGESFIGKDSGGRAKRLSCRACIYDSRCRGVSVVYAQRFGLEALNPAGLHGRASLRSEAP